MRATTEFVEQEIISAKRRTEWKRDVIYPTLRVIAGIVVVSIPLIKMLDHLTWAESAANELSVVPWFIAALVLWNGFSAHSDAATLGIIKGMARMYEQEALDFVRRNTEQ